MSSKRELVEVVISEDEDDDVIPHDDIPTTSSPSIAAAPTNGTSAPKRPRISAPDATPPSPARVDRSRFDSTGSDEDLNPHPFHSRQIISTDIDEEEEEIMDVEISSTVVIPPEELEKEQAEAKPFEDLTEREKQLLGEDVVKAKEADYQRRLIRQLPVYYPGINGCRSINEFSLLNRISEGTFGVVYRAREKTTDEVVALKQLKMEKEKDGFPITSLREINMLMKCRSHPNVVGLREIVTDATGEKIYMVMEFVEHDLRALMRQLKARKKKFTLAQSKALMQQLLSGLAYMHDEWVIHRDLKTANLLLSHGNILKIGDFGLAREYGNPLKKYTSLVVTLHYRCPELLLGIKEYSTAVDMWSVGCIFGELLKLDPILEGTSDTEQVKLIFEAVGTPNAFTWPGYTDLPHVKDFSWPYVKEGNLEARFKTELRTEAGRELLTALLHPCPERRISADAALKHAWFTEDPKPAPPESFPTWPAKSENLKAPPPRPAENAATVAAKAAANNIDPERFRLLREYKVDVKTAVKSVGGFSLKFGGR